MEQEMTDSQFFCFSTFFFFFLWKTVCLSETFILISTWIPTEEPRTDLFF